MPNELCIFKREFDSQGTNFGILSRLQFWGKVVGSLVGIAHANWAYGTQKVGSPCKPNS